MKSRREFIVNSGKAALTVMFAAPLLQSCSNLIRKEIDYDKMDNQLENILGISKIKILQAASYAPSGHNAQPWIVKLMMPDKWIISLNKNALLKAADPLNHDTIISIGAFLYNLKFASEIFGYRIESNLICNDYFAEDLVEINLYKAKPQFGNINEMALRRTIRKNIQKQTLSEENIKSLSEHSKETIFYFEASSIEGKYISDATLEANIIQSLREDVQIELADWIRWSNSEARLHMDGLTPATMDITGFAGLYVRTFFNRNTVLSEDFRLKGIDMVKEQLSSFGGWIVLTSGSGSAEDLINTGKNLQELWLKARKLSIAIHPMTQILQEGNWKKEISKELSFPGEVGLVLRTGYVKDYPDAVSLRKPVERFTRLS
jgi:hypothetical protein